MTYVLELQNLWAHVVIPAVTMQILCIRAGLPCAAQILAGTCAVGATAKIATCTAMAAAWVQK